MKIGIVYGTKRQAATEEIVSWMTEHLSSLGHAVVHGKPGDFAPVDCDLYILGTAVYAFSAKRAGLHTFIRGHGAELGAKPVAVFIVCGADPLESHDADTEGALKRGLKRFFLDRDKYMASLTQLLPRAPVATEFFKGYQEPGDREQIDFESQKDRVAAWCDAVLASQGT